MVFSVIVSITPCLTQNLSPESRKKLKEYYRTAKKYGIRGLLSVVAGTVCYTVLKEAATEGVKRHGKRYVGSMLVNSGVSLASAGLPLITNATKVVKYSKACHSVCAATWRVTHNLAELPFLLCDFAVFGEIVPSCEENAYDIFGGNTDILSQFTDSD